MITTTICDRPKSSQIDGIGQSWICRRGTPIALFLVVPIWYLRTRKQSQQVCRVSKHLIVRVIWWAHQGSNLGPAD